MAFQGTVADFFAAGLVSPAVALHYGCSVDFDGLQQLPEHKQPEWLPG